MRATTFHGKYVRVQLQALDRLLPPETVKFAVYGISAKHHPSTAFRGKAGKQLYYGPDFNSAWAAVLKHVPDAVLPPLLARKFANEPFRLTSEPYHAG